MPKESAKILNEQLIVNHDLGIKFNEYGILHSCRQQMVFMNGI